MQVFLDRRFRKNYARVYNSEGWADTAWVNYVAVPSNGKGVFGKLTERLVDSVHRFSQHPIVVVNFGTKAPEELDPEKFPHLVLLHARGLKPIPISFNFNKLRAVLLAQVKVGASLDSDMLMVTAQADHLLNRTAEEITEKYPFPMMPTHFLDRDVRDSDTAKRLHEGNFLSFSCKDCPTPTMRWGQAQPTWTYWSLPFLSRWLSAKVAGRKEQGVPTAGIAEDEDLLNVALWQEGATKAWCAFQTGGINFLWENVDPQHPPGPYPYYEFRDPRVAMPAMTVLCIIWLKAEMTRNTALVPLEEDSEATASCKASATQKAFLDHVEAGRLDRVEDMLEFHSDKIDVNFQDPVHGRTPLMLAALAGNLDLVEVLLEARADPHIRERTEMCYTPLEAAQVIMEDEDGDFEELVQLLAKASGYDHLPPRRSDPGYDFRR
ncbi:unnamed protein product [Symbiodinium natans]|uniref:Uncharacterized protein n=1 Tax=Symbiodinium natans TaxID=878477 RepID=A0A812STA8_9DINO|nr:unnamed protein product [Symbiodinium natans]